MQIVRAWILKETDEEKNNTRQELVLVEVSGSVSGLITLPI